MKLLGKHTKESIVLNSFVINSSRKITEIYLEIKNIRKSYLKIFNNSVIPFKFYMPIVLKYILDIIHQCAVDEFKSYQIVQMN